MKAAGSLARLGQDAPGHPLGRDQTGKVKLDARQRFTQVPGLPSKLAAALGPVGAVEVAGAQDRGGCPARPRLSAVTLSDTGERAHWGYVTRPRKPA